MCAVLILGFCKGFYNYNSKNVVLQRLVTCTCRHCSNDLECLQVEEKKTKLSKSLTFFFK